MIYDSAISFEENRFLFMNHKWKKPTHTFINGSAQSFLGFSIMSPIGVAACPLTSSAASVVACWNWGFSLVTYKTIRSMQKKAHPIPNVAPLVYQGALCSEDIGGVMYADTYFSRDQCRLSVANSIGNASMAIENEMQQIAVARSAAKEGNVLIVSIYGSEDNGVRSLKDDFVYIALSAKKAGAHIIEANFSCPNVSGKMLYEDQQSFFEISNALVRALGATPLLIKMGFTADDRALREVLIGAARAGVAGVTGINSVPMQIVGATGNSYFGNRAIAGVSGASITLLAQDFVRRTRSIIIIEKLDLMLCGVGGITTPDQFDLMHQAGADIALSATGAMWNVELAYEYHQKYQLSFVVGQHMKLDKNGI